MEVFGLKGVGLGKFMCLLANLGGWREKGFRLKLIGFRVQSRGFFKGSGQVRGASGKGFSAGSAGAGVQGCCVTGIYQIAGAVPCSKGWGVNKVS